MNPFYKDEEMNIKPSELLKSLKLSNQEITLDITVPDSFYQTLLEQVLERDYLNYVSDKVFDVSKADKTRTNIQWMQITRLPVHPNQNESYDLLSRWQGVLSSFHAWGYRMIFILLRHDGETRLFIGTVSNQKEVSAEEAVEQMREAAFGSMPGMGMRLLSSMEYLDELREPLMGLRQIGAVTGIPSFRNTEGNKMMQTLDSLAFGIQDYHGHEKDYALMVIADPVNDGEISDIISRHRVLSSKIHTAVKQIGNTSVNRSESKNLGAGAAAAVGTLGSIVGGMVGSLVGAPLLGSRLGSGIGGMANLQKQVSAGGSAGMTLEYLDRFAEYAESSVNVHIQRLNEGRNLGFWNTGVYVLGDSRRDVTSVTGMLRSIYSGEQTYYEPIRIHLFKNNSNALEIVRDNYDLIPLVDVSLMKDLESHNIERADTWHLFGDRYQYLSTPINTKELSLVTSLPRRDVPGLRFVKTAVRFANNPAVISNEEDSITIGNIVDTGIVQNTTYDINVNALVRHALVAGSTGSGKSTTCKRILSEVLRRDIPVMVIEPAKDDYVRWAIEMNKTLPEEKKFIIYMPGCEEVDGYPVEPLRLNPFEPAAVKGAKVNLLQHSEAFATLLNACLPSEDVVPILMEEVVYETIKGMAEYQGRDFDAESVEPLEYYPTIETMLDVSEWVMDRKNYFAENKDNLTEILVTRFRTLMRGTRGKILNQPMSTDFSQLFDRNVIINISNLSGSKDKSLIMSLLMQALYEYRMSCYRTDMNYRRIARQNKLMHLTLVEEAHNVLLKSERHASSGDPQAAAADLFGRMLSEIREYGQGMLVVDQVPTRLIDDAIKNTNYKIVHRLTAPDDQKLMASCMAFREDQTYIIPALEKGNAIICGDEDDAAAWVRIPAPGKDVK